MSGTETDSFALRIMASGLLENVISNPRFWRQLETRIFIAYELGLLLGFFGAVLLFLPKPKFSKH